MVIDYLNILNNLPDAICVVGQVNHEVLFVNNTFDDQLLPRNILINKDFVAEIFKPTDADKFNEAIQAADASIDDVTLGSILSLSHIGENKCKLSMHILQYRYVLI